MAHNVVDAESVYNSTGIPAPGEIEQFLRTLSNPSVSFAAGLQGLQNLLVSKGFALDDFLNLMHAQLVAMDVPTSQRLQMVTALSDIDWRLKLGCNEKLQLAAMIGIFHEARNAGRP